MADDEYSEIVKKLTKETDNGEIEWEAYDPTEEAEGDVETEDGYRTEYKGKELKIYKRVKEVPLTQIEKAIYPATKPIGPLNPADTPQTKRKTKTILKLRDLETGGEWVFPKMSMLSDLHSSAQQQAAGVREWMTEVLDEDN